MVGGEKALMVTYWGSDKGDKKMTDQMSKIMGSVQVAKK
jgi:hypothetical protein